MNQQTPVRKFSAELFEYAISIIDEYFGKGYAMRNPTLLAAVVESVTEVYLAVHCNQE